jgi:hypothetical protein
MIKTINTATEVTYKQLERALQSVGFERFAHPTYIAYIHRPTETVFALPATRPGAMVMGAHLVAAKGTVTGRGVASHEQWASALERAKRSTTTAVSAAS